MKISKSNLTENEAINQVEEVRIQESESRRDARILANAPLSMTR
ncbi:hypothetical protein [Nostoc sp. DedQUE09]|nr:hypothetical protein [Nostoc sp. DedQUE09]